MGDFVQLVAGPLTTQQPLLERSGGHSPVTVVGTSHPM